MKKLIILSLIALLFTACKSHQPIINYQTKDSIVYKHKTDSFYLYEKDSIYIFQKGDTVFKTVFKYKDKYHSKIDTAYITLSELEKIPYPVTTIKKVTPKWCWWLLGINCLLLFLFVLYRYIKSKR